jgi:hypothetical protein
MPELRAIDLRGNMEAGDMTLEVVGRLPHLTAIKHRSTAVTDAGLAGLAESKTLESLLMQDFVITNESGPHLAKLSKLSSLEVFRCQGFGTDGVLALAGLPLTRLTLRDLPDVGDPALAVVAKLPRLKRLYLHELASLGDEGLRQLAAATDLEVLDIVTMRPNRIGRPRWRADGVCGCFLPPFWWTPTAWCRVRCAALSIGPGPWPSACFSPYLSAGQQALRQGLHRSV